MHVLKLPPWYLQQIVFIHFYLILPSNTKGICIKEHVLIQEMSFI